MNAPYYIFEYLWESLDYQADPLVNSYRAPTKEFLQLSFRINFILTNPDHIQAMDLIQNLQNDGRTLSNCSEGKVKHVVGKLEKCWTKLVHTESNMFLFNELLKRNISTRDVFFFALKQAKIRKIYKKLDPPLSKVAMKSKLNDACAMAHRLRQELNRVRQNLLMATGNRKFKQKKLIKQTRLKIESLRTFLKAKNIDKISRYESLQIKMVDAQEASSFKIPESLEKFSNLKIFSSENLLKDGAEIDPPLICDDKITLSQDEINLLSKGPKFSVRRDLVENDFKLEVEKSICKRKFSVMEDPPLESTENHAKTGQNTSISTENKVFNKDWLEDFICNKQTNKMDNEICVLKDSALHRNGQFEHFPVSDQNSKKNLCNLPVSTNEKRACCSGQFSADRTSSNRKLDGELAVSDISDTRLKWEQRKTQLVYNFEDSSVDMTKLKASDYKYIRSTTLPGPQDSISELGHELRKQECMKVFQDLTKKTDKTSHSSASKSNLSPGEIQGLKSLKSRIKKGELVVCQSDKSNKFCVLSREQYIAAGLSHCSKDLKVNSTEVKRLQAFVNSNVAWIHDIVGTGHHWNHHDRIIRSTNDQGCQIAPLKILIKDHKNWSQKSGTVVPSRPVINGNSGFNCHLSELLSLILGPVAQEATGNEINSTGDLLSRIHRVNSLLQTGESQTSDLDTHCDFCQQCNVPEPTDLEKDKAKAVVDRMMAKKPKSAMHITTNLKNMLNASREATKLYHRACMGSSRVNEDDVFEDGVTHSHSQSPPRSQLASSGHSVAQSEDANRDVVRSNDGVASDAQSDSPEILGSLCSNNTPVLNTINDNGNLVVSGFDVESLYPNLSSIDAACLARETIIHSNIDFAEFDVELALMYLTIVAGREAMIKAGLHKFIPTYKGDRLSQLKVTGTTGKDKSNWTFSAATPSKAQEKVILAMIIEVGVLIVMNSHVYEFQGDCYLQCFGGPIGLAITAWLASIVMQCFDNLWLQLVQKNNITLWDYMRYVDDCREFYPGISKGWYWSGKSFSFSTDKLAEDLDKNELDEVRSTRLMTEAKNSIMPFLKFTCESTADFHDSRLPTLDCSIFIKDGIFQHSFFEKPMRTDRSLFATTALSQETITSSLREEFIRRLTTLHHYSTR